MKLMLVKLFLKVLQSIYWLIIIFLSIILIYNSIPYYSFRTDYYFFLEKGDLADQLLWKICFYLHISGAMVSLLVGIPNCFVWLLKRYRQLHIRLGQIYVASILLVSCPTGFYMSFYTKGGVMGVIPFMSIAVLWFITTLVAYRHIKNKRTKQHALWMIRSFAITLSALSFRLIQMILALVFEYEPVENYIASLWISLIGNVILGEIGVLYYKRKYFNKNKTIIL